MVYTERGPRRQQFTWHQPMFVNTFVYINIVCFDEGCFEFNPFTAPACKNSGLKDAWTRLQTVYLSVQ